MTKAGNLVATRSPPPVAPGDVFLSAIYDKAPHVLSLLDRERFSPTRGCFDRTHWAWKFTDFPGARFQEGLCVLSFLLTHEDDDNPYYSEPKLLEWITGGFDFWVDIQRPSGDFDEAYPFERSLAATAFTSFYLAEAWRLLAGRLPPEAGSRFRRALERAGDWLVKNDERHGFLSNHLAAAATALYHAYQICEAERFEARSVYFLDRILEHQSEEGWYDEYGGADPGYQSHGSFYLARYWELSQHPKLLDSLARSFRFLAHFVHPDGSLGGEYASRNTQTYYPAAFEMMSAKSGSASWIAETMLPSVISTAAAGLRTVDAYNLFPLLNNYVFAYRATKESDHRGASSHPPARKPLTYFPGAGIAKIQRERFELYVGLSKGGVIKAFDHKVGQLRFSDCGYLGRLRGGGFLSSQWFDKTRQVDISEHEIVIRSSLYGLRKVTMQPFRFLGFRAFTLTVGRIAALSYWLKSLLVRVLIYRKRALPIAFERRISITDDGFEVRDRLQGRPEGIRELEWVDNFTTIHMGSSRYFIPNELTPNELANAPTETGVDLSRLSEGVTIVRRVRFDS